MFDLHTPVIVPSSFDDQKFGKSQYERMVSAIDDWIFRLLENIDKKNTIIIITSDHGEIIPVVETKDGIISLESSTTEKSLSSQTKNGISNSKITRKNKIYNFRTK